LENNGSAQKINPDNQHLSKLSYLRCKIS